MPDVRDSTLASPSADSPRRSAVQPPQPSATVSAIECDHASAIRTTLRDVATELRALERRLASVAEGLPRPCGQFSMLSELRGVIDCVCDDLLVDAIETFEAAGAMTEGELRQRFEERRCLLIL